MFDARDYQIQVRTAESREEIWFNCIAIGMGMTQQGPVPVVFYESDKGTLDLALGSPKIRCKREPHPTTEVPPAEGR